MWCRSWLWCRLHGLPPCVLAWRGTWPRRQRCCSTPSPPPVAASWPWPCTLLPCTSPARRASPTCHQHPARGGAGTKHDKSHTVTSTLARHRTEGLRTSAEGRHFQVWCTHRSPRGHHRNLPTAPPLNRGRRLPSRGTPAHPHTPSEGRFCGKEPLSDILLHIRCDLGSYVSDPEPNCAQGQPQSLHIP